MAESNEQIAIFKFNNGHGALLCSGCRGILKTGNQFTEEERKAFKGELKLPPQTCNTVKVECKRFDGQR